MTEYLKFAGGRLLFFITKLFNGCLKHEFAPDSFASSIIIPVPIDKENQCDKFDEYRPVSLVTIFSKAFESYLLEQPSILFYQMSCNLVLLQGKIAKKPLCF